MNPREYQALAERWVSGLSPSGAECRAAISRAYYAAFNVGAEFLRAMGFRIARGGAAHGEVRLCLSNGGDPDVAGAASVLGDLHSDRNRADYHLDRTDVDNSTHAGNAVRKASEAIRALDGAAIGSRRVQIQAAILAWRRANSYP
jgi:hypothetical protein